MKEVFLVNGCRSPIGRAHPDKGDFRNIRADELVAQVLLHLVDRISLDPGSVDDFYLGCVGQHLEQGKNLGRLVLLLSGFPETVPSLTINRLCASSFSAVQMAADCIRADSGALMLVGGVEHMGHVSMTASLDYNAALFTDAPFQWTNMGLTAEYLAEEYDISRTEQDEFTLKSNEKYFSAKASGFFKNEIIPILTTDGMISDDQQPRLSSMDKLRNLKSVFKDNGSVTAANSSGIGDGAAVGLLCNREKLVKNRWEPLARILNSVNVGVNPARMGLAPVYAIKKLLKNTNMTMESVDLFEINEAFAAQMIPCLRELEIDETRLNVHGGAVALGHPLGMSGFRIINTLAHSLKYYKRKYGIAAMCVGHGQGVAMLLENPDCD